MLVDLVRRRPDWDIIILESPPFTIPQSGAVWGFIDAQLPATSGSEICHMIRVAQRVQRVNLVMVIDPDNPDGRLQALQSGADDYITAPLDAGQLIDRVERGALGNRTKRELLTHGSLTLDITAHQVRHNGAAVHLRPSEFNLLLHFMRNPDQVFSRPSLAKAIGKDVDNRTVDQWVVRMRRSLIKHGVKDPIRTVRSVGYALDSIRPGTP
jgi:two-component system phosphate regulon response regulator PhoB